MPFRLVRSFTSNRRLQNAFVLLATIFACMVLHSFTLFAATWPAAIGNLNLLGGYRSVAVKVAHNKEAYVTLISSRQFADPLAEDLLYNSTRLQVYSLLHDPKLKDVKRDFVVMVDKFCPLWRRLELTRDGAIVKEVETVELPFTVPNEKYNMTFQKLRVWELEEYTRVLFLDADIVVIKPLEELWNHESNVEQKVLEKGSYSVRNADEGELEGDLREAGIKTYVMAAYYDKLIHLWAGSPKNLDLKNYLNSGILLVKPSKALYNHLVKLLPYQSLYGGLAYPEQNLFNFVFRPTGPMPWSRMPDDRIEKPPPADAVEKGYILLHQRFWELGVGRKREEYLKVQGRMDGFYASRYSKLQRHQVR